MTKPINRMYDTSRMWEKQCVYCGSPRECADHVLPLAVANRIDWSKPESKRYARMLIVVASCMECNSLAGATFYMSLSHKIEGIHKKIRKKHAVALRTAEWTETELRQLGHSLRTSVEHGRKEKEETKRRLLLSEKHRVLARLAWPTSITITSEV